jgi:hypothetical protein
MYIFGGQISSLHNTNRLHEYDFNNDTWNEIIMKIKDDNYPPVIDSHSSCVYKNEQDKSTWLFFGGFSSQKGMGFLNKVYSYSFEEN